MCLIGLGVSIVAFRLQIDLVKKPSIRAKEDIFKKILTPIILVSTLLGWRLLVDVNIFDHHCLPIMYILTFFWGRNLMYIQLCHVAGQRFHSLNIGNVAYLIVWAISVALYSLGWSQ